MFNYSNRESASTWYPKINVTENVDAFLVQFLLPGVSPEDVKLHVESNSLSVSGFKIAEREVKNDNTRTHTRERHTDSFNQLIELDATIDIKSITAKLLDGVLNIKIPKKGVTPEKIDIIIE